MKPDRFFSLDSPKAVKARGFGYMNAINYMAPAQTAFGPMGPNLCPDASAGCLALCLGWYSGQAGMIAKTADQDTARNAARDSRQRKSIMFMADRKAFLRLMIKAIKSAERAAARLGLKLCVRPNGATDIPWNAIRDENRQTIFEIFPHIQFVDYTKSLKRALAHARGQMPKNYHLTFSRSETNEADCLLVLHAGGNVAVVSSRPMPETYLGHVVINGDEHDLRHLDNKTAARGACVVWLSPKGTRAKRDQSGMVLR
jgi:hypothetical protein